MAQRSVQQLTYEHVDDGLWYAAHELSITRGLAVERALAASDEVACIFAEIEDPAPPAKLDDPTAIEKHWQVVRALVRVPRVREQSQ